jgi:hypothetical protein
MHYFHTTVEQAVATARGYEGVHAHVLGVGDSLAVE